MKTNVFQSLLKTLVSGHKSPKVDIRIREILRCPRLSLDKFFFSFRENMIQILEFVNGSDPIFPVEDEFIFVAVNLGNFCSGGIFELFLVVPNIKKLRISEKDFDSYLGTFWYVLRLNLSFGSTSVNL